jgi:hypothetical protein
MVVQALNRSARGSGGCGVVGADRRQAGVGDQRPRRAGKSYVLGVIGKAWEQAGFGRVIGVTPSQSARNTFALGAAESYNSAQFLGHLPGQRGARGPVDTNTSGVQRYE